MTDILLLPAPFHVRGRRAELGGESRWLGVGYAEVSHRLRHRVLGIVARVWFSCGNKFGWIVVVVQIGTPVTRHFTNDFVRVVALLEVTDVISPVPFGLAGSLAIRHAPCTCGGWK